jgi:hypothetical protein
MRSKTLCKENKTDGSPLFPASEAPTVLYVDANIGGENNGASWANVFTDLHEALGVVIILSAKYSAGMFNEDCSS